jgi:hypothetical protein
MPFTLKPRNQRTADEAGGRRHQYVHVRCPCGATGRSPTLGRRLCGQAGTAVNRDRASPLQISASPGRALMAQLA